MAETPTTLADILKDAWGPNQLVQQFEDKAGPLKRIKKVPATMIGAQAQVPIHKYNAGGFTSFGSAGGDFNTYNNVGVDQAVYTLVTLGMPIDLQFSALNQAGGSNAQSVIASKDLAVKAAISEIGKQGVRQLVTNGDGIVAQCDSGGASTTVELLASPSGTAYGYDALRRNWLHVGSIVDIGTTSDTDSQVTGTTVTAINNSASDPDIVIGTSISTTSGTHFVYIANPNSTSAANSETNGLRNIVNTSGALGGLNPATAGEEFWAAAARDTSTTVFSLDLALNIQQEVLQNSGEMFTDVWTGFKQQRNFYSLLQNQVRFNGEMNMGAGDVEKPTWNNMRVSAYPDILDSDWHCLTLSDFQYIHGKYREPVWASDLQNEAGMQWRPGTTQFSDAVLVAYQLGVARRNTHGSATGLTA